MGTSERKDSYSLRLREVCWSQCDARSSTPEVADATHVKKDGTERYTVESPEDTGCDGNDGGCSGSTEASVRHAWSRPVDSADAMHSLVHESEFTE